MPQDNKKKLPKITKKSLMYGGYSIILTVVMVVALVLLNMGVTTLSDTYGLNIDMTSNRLYSITGQSKEMVRNLEEDIYVYTLFQNGQEDDIISEILKRFAAQGSHFIVENIDPIQNPGFVQQFQREGETIQTNSVIVTDSEKKRLRVFSQSDMYTTEYDSSSGMYAITGVNVEAKVSSAILYLTSEDMPVVYFLQGHGEPMYSQFPYLQDLLADQNFDVREIDLRTTDVQLTQEDTLVILAPTSDLDDTERETLKAYMEGGCKVFAAFNPLAGELPNFDSLLQLYGVKRLNGIVVENNRDNYYTGSQIYLIPNYMDSEITATLMENNLNVLLPTSGALELPELTPSNFMTINSLLESSSDAYMTFDFESATLTQKDTDPTGTFVLAATITNYEGEENESRLVLFNNVVGISMAENVPYANEDFYLNCMTWLAGETEDLYIRGKSLNSSMLYFSNATQMLTTVVLVWPVIVVVMLIAAFVIYRQRKHL